MQFQWVGQFGVPVCKPGERIDPTGRFCIPIPPGQPGGPPLPVALVPAGVTVTPVTATEEKNRTLLYAAAIVAGGIVAAMALSRFAS